MDFYNDMDAGACAWLRELIKQGHLPQGTVDERSITDLPAAELVRYRRVHLFAGIGGWAYALELARWPADRPVWTGSCPCQPFSAAGKRKGEADERHLWPVFFRLIRECRPATLFGEQVASADGYLWLSRVRSDLEAEAYAVGCADLPAACVGAPHIRQRLFWVATLGRAADAGCAGLQGRQQGDDSQRTRRGGRLPSAGSGIAGGPADSDSARIRARRHGESAGAPAADQGSGHQRQRLRADARNDGTLGDPSDPGQQPPRDDARPGEDPQADQPASGRRDKAAREPGRRDGAGHASDAESVGCRQGSAEYARSREGIGAEGAGIGSADHLGCGAVAASDTNGTGQKSSRGPISRPPEAGNDTGRSGAAGHRFWDAFDILDYRDGKRRRVEPGTFPLAHGIPRRMVKLRGYGNAILPQAAAVFIQAFLEAERGMT